MLSLSLMTSVLSVDDWFCCQLKGDWDYPMDALQVVFANPEHRPGNFVLLFPRKISRQVICIYFLAFVKD